MSYNRFAASAPLGVIELRCLEISHPDPAFGEPLRLVHDFRDWEVTLENNTEVTFTAAQFRTTPPAIDESGRITRSLKIDNVDGAIFNALKTVADSLDPVTCTMRIYLSNDISAPQFLPPERTILRGITLSGGTLSAEALSIDVVNKRFPTRMYTTDNTPGLRR